MRWLKPHVETVAIEGSDAEVLGVVQRSNYKPWYSEQDASNVMFVSVHGYGPRERGLEHLFPRAAFYPGSGKTSLPVVPPPSPRTEATAMASAWSASSAPAFPTTTSSSHPSRSAPMEEEDDDNEEGDSNNSNEQPPSRDGSEDSIDGDDEDEEEMGEGEGDDEESMLARLQAMEGGASGSRGGAYGRLLAAKRTLGSFAPLSGSRAVENAEAIAADPRLVAGGMPALILDIGVELPDGEAEHDRGKALAELNYRIQWRKYFRDEIFPRLMKFKPDFLFISAGFDAHKKDTINGGYIALVGIICVVCPTEQRKDDHFSDVYFSSRLRRTLSG